MKNIIFFLAAVAACAVCAEIPLSEHPRPDWERAEWVNLNGSWRFAFDKSDEGVRDKWFSAGNEKFGKSIVVPFPWGCALSGVKDEADIGWYRREVTVPEAWKGKRVFVVVGASDHDTTMWFGDSCLGEHSGGYTPFEYEITDHVKWGKAQRMTFRVWDQSAEVAHIRHKSGDWRLYGKQGYGNVRGIWQTVYLEARGQEFLDTVHFTPDIENGSVTADVTLGAPAKIPLAFEVRFKEEDRAKPATATFTPGQMSAKVKIPLRNVKLWNLENPYLYEVTCSLAPETATEGFTPDNVKTYFGMRKIGVGKIPGTEHPCVTLNNKPIYLQLTLDQSYHPEGFYTFPSDEFMKNEILISKKLALSGNRIHIKVEVPRKLYWADKLGLFIMADVPNAWGAACEAMFREHAFCLEDMIKRDFNHPSIFSWVLFNETWGLFADGENWGKNRAKRYAPWVRRQVAKTYARAKRLDPTRLVEDNSPCNRDHVVTDLNSWHCYLPGYKWEDEVVKHCKESFPGSRANYVGGFVQGNEPMFNSECGNVWGYKGSTGDCDWSWDYHWMLNAFRRNLQCCGWLYTEHHDVINEWNGYVRYDRTPKYTGIEELTRERMALKDLHADAYMPLDRELCREFKAGETWTMPVDISLITDKYAGRKFSLWPRLMYWNAAGRFHELALSKTDPFTVSAWHNGRVADVPVVLPKETACGIVCFSLVADGDEDDTKAIARNFACFVTRSERNVDLVSVTPGAFKKAEWSQRRWEVLDGLKVCGAGSGFFEYEFDGVKAGKKAVFRAEVSAKRLNAKDAKDFNDKGVQDLDCMLGGGFASRSKNPNSYPMTSDDKWPGAVKVYVNGELVKTVELPDDPADHRGILSWHSQPRDKTLHEAGSYGYLVEVEIPEAVLAKGGGKATVRLETEKGGLAVYGAKFGRFPFDPYIEFSK